MGLLISLFLFFFSFFFIPKQADFEKNSSYECGFDPFEESRSKFEVHFYLVSILFIIFDLEIMFLFPWGLVLTQIGIFGLLTMFYFFFLLTLGFMYEWLEGALEWE